MERPSTLWSPSDSAKDLGCASFFTIRSLVGGFIPTDQRQLGAQKPWVQHGTQLNQRAPLQVDFRVYLGEQFVSKRTAIRLQLVKKLCGALRAGPCVGEQLRLLFEGVRQAGLKPLVTADSPVRPILRPRRLRPVEPLVRSRKRLLPERTEIRLDRVDEPDVRNRIE